MVEVLYIGFGWLLGLLAPTIVEKIRRPYARRDLQASFTTELQELNRRLVLTVFQLSSRAGKLDKALISWCLEKYGKVGYHPKEEDILVSMKKLLDRSDQELEAANNMRRLETKKTLNIRILSAPIITANIAQLSIFDITYQGKILEIISRVNILNEMRIETRELHALTFTPGITAENREIINQNFDNSWDVISAYSKDTVDMTQSVLIYKS